MKKIILIAGLLLVAFDGWAEEEFPIELTCDFTESIIYFNLEKEMKDSWFGIHSSLNEIHKKWVFLDKKYLNKQNKFSEQVIKDSAIYLRSAPAVAKIDFRINRLTGSAYIGRDKLLAVGNVGDKLTAGGRKGHCYKGFKEYTEKKF